MSSSDRSAGSRAGGVPVVRCRRAGGCSDRRGGLLSAPVAARTVPAGSNALAPAVRPAPEAPVDDRPLVLTLLLEPAAQARFDDLRRAHFPPERNHLQAHVTLFHALPGHEVDRVRADVREVAERQAYDVDVVRVRSLGRGVAYDLRSAELDAQRAELARRWQDVLTPQDARPSAPHVTVQNKVDPDAARALLRRLQAAFAPHAVGATGLGLWRYLGGPWEPLEAYRFSPAATG